MLTTALKTRTMKVMKLKLLNPMLPTPPLGQDLLWILCSPFSLCPKSCRSLWNSMHLSRNCNLDSAPQRVWLQGMIFAHTVLFTSVMYSSLLFDNSEMCSTYNVAILLVLLLFQGAKSNIVNYMPLGFDQEEEECATTKVREILSEQFDELHRYKT